MNWMMELEALPTKLGDEAEEEASLGGAVH